MLTPFLEPAPVHGILENLSDEALFHEVARRIGGNIAFYANSPLTRDLISQIDVLRVATLKQPA